MMGSGDTLASRISVWPERMATGRRDGQAPHRGGPEEWELDEDLKVKASLGWYDAEDDARQAQADQPQGG